MRDTRWDIAKRGHEIPEFGRRFYANEIHTGQSPNVVTRYLFLATDSDHRKIFGADLAGCVDLAHRGSKIWTLKSRFRSGFSL